MQHAVILTRPSPVQQMQPCRQAARAGRGRSECANLARNGTAAFADGTQRSTAALAARPPGGIPGNGAAPLTLFISKISSLVSITRASSTPTCTHDMMHSSRDRRHTLMRIRAADGLPACVCPLLRTVDAEVAAPAGVRLQRAGKRRRSSPRHTRSQSPPPSCRARLRAAGRAGARWLERGGTGELPRALQNAR